MLARLCFIFSLLLFSANVSAEYYIVTPCQNCGMVSKTYTVHHITHHAKTVKRHVVHHRSPCKKMYVKRYHEECADGFCANGHYIQDKYYHGYKFAAFPYTRDKHFKRDYEDYNNDLATGDDDTYKNPDMQIN